MPIEGRYMTFSRIAKIMFAKSVTINKIVDVLDLDVTFK